MSEPLNSSKLNTRYINGLLNMKTTRISESGS